MMKKALVIDDDGLCLDIMSEYLTLKQFAVTASPSATCPMIEQQMDTCPMETPCYETLLSDYHMPGMTGLELFEYQSNRGCKVLAKHKALISGAISVDEQKKAESSGYKVFQKPAPLHQIDNWFSALWENNEKSNVMPKVQDA